VEAVELEGGEVLVNPEVALVQEGV
jgi:hypothetical protein